MGSGCSAGGVLIVSTTISVFRARHSVTHRRRVVVRRVRFFPAHALLDEELAFVIENKDEGTPASLRRRIGSFITARAATRVKLDTWRAALAHEPLHAHHSMRLGLSRRRLILTGV